MCQWSEHFPGKQILHYNEPCDGSLLPEIWAGNIGTVLTTCCLNQLHIQITEGKFFKVWCLAYDEVWISVILPSLPSFSLSFLTSIYFEL